MHNAVDYAVKFPRIVWTLHSFPARTAFRYGFQSGESMGRGQSIMASAGARAYNGGAHSGGRAPGQGVKVRSPLEAENCLASGCATEAANLPHSVRTLTLSK